MMKIGKRVPYCVPVEKIRFICEQDGVPERGLKKEISKLLVRDKRVSRAYLVRIAIEGSDEYLVALCLSIDSGKKLPLVRKVSKIFSKMFSANQHIEIMFLDEKAETKVVGVCSPFYVRMNKR